MLTKGEHLTKDQRRQAVSLPRNFVEVEVMPEPAIAVEKSGNSKTGTVSVTHASQASCPSDCPFLRNGCYAETGPQGAFVTAKLNASTEKRALQVARVEAAVVRKLTGKRDLRGHVVGDCKTDATAKVVSRAYDAHAAKHGRSVWSYTHAWQDVARESWGGVSILASCESVSQAKLAMGRSYAAAVVVDSFQQPKAYELDGVKLIPCPEQTRGVKCVDCRLCFNDKALLEREAVIGFLPHGSGAAKVLAALA